jgi:hypothetical protein
LARWVSWAAFVRNGTPDVDGGNVQLPLEEYQAQHRCGLWRQLPVIMDRGDPRP